VRTYADRHAEFDNAIQRALEAIEQAQYQEADYFQTVAAPWDPSGYGREQRSRRVDYARNGAAQSLHKARRALEQAFAAWSWPADE
jgi:hypothetical protein